MPTKRKDKISLEKLWKALGKLREMRGEYTTVKKDWTVALAAFTNRLVIRNDRGAYLGDIDIGTGAYEEYVYTLHDKEAEEQAQAEADAAIGAAEAEAEAREEYEAAMAEADEERMKHEG